jgi:23S rRNA (uracil1939-C5)-methyltransferase
MPESITIEKLVYGGHGLARVDGRVILTPFVLPGERVVVEPEDQLHARLLSAEEPSPERTAPGCPYFGECGGCHYQHARYEYQLEQKVAILREVMRRVGKFDAPANIRVIHGPEWGYRNRSQFHIRDGKLGYLKAGSHELVPIEQCPISSPRLNECIVALNAMLQDRRFPQFVKEIELFTNETETQLNVLETDRPVARSFFDWAAERIPGYTPGPITYHGFRVSYKSFFQVNRFLIDQLVEASLGEAEGGWALDLYAGVGLFSWTMAQQFKRVTGVDSTNAAVSDLVHNVPKAEAVRSSVDEYLAGLSDAPEFVLADPPRSGLGKYAVRHLVRLKPQRIHIVACDPATLARDMAPLLAAGYAMDEMILVDLFPQTYHLETIVRLSYK